LVRHPVGAATNEPFDPILLSCHLLVVAVLGGTAAALCQNSALPASALRIAEMVIFGLPAAFFLLLQPKTTLVSTGRHVMSAPSTPWLLLIFTYGMFIPNTTRRAALVIGSMALLPLLLVSGMTGWYSSVAAVVTPGDLVHHVLVMVVAAAGSLFGTH